MSLGTDFVWPAARGRGVSYRKNQVYCGHPGPSSLPLKISLSNIPLLLHRDGEKTAFTLMFKTFSSFLFWLVSSAAVPSLTHLCRLEIRSSLKPQHLRSDSFICQLPLPRSLHNYLLYADVLRMNDIPDLAVIQDGDISEAP